MSAPLAGLKVLDLSRVLAGPFATMTLADLGAEVVKVEPPGGDDTRRFGPPFSGGISTYFLSVNRGKRSIVLDLKTPGDLGICRDLAARADILIENFRPGVMERLGLGPQEIRRENPTIIYCRISAFGQEDPRPGYDVVMQHASGIPSITGEPGEEAMKCGASIADLVSGHNAVEGILAALYRRASTGEGALVEVRLMDSIRAMLAYHAGSWLNAGAVPARIGNGHVSVHPYGVYHGADGAFVLAVAQDVQFRALCGLLELPGLLLDPRFQTNPGRVEHRGPLDEALAPALAARPVGALLVALEAAGIPAGPVNDVPGALEGAPIVWQPHPSAGQPGAPERVGSLPTGFQLDEAPWFSERPPPGEAGAHRKEVLEDWLG